MLPGSIYCFAVVFAENTLCDDEILVKSQNPLDNRFEISYNYISGGDGVAAAYAIFIIHLLP
ncbi:MAG TPA: hypothetical protein DCZ71_00185 [Ruminococcus sp.]|nr:hypothetical protein [Ruminococcus sp.]